MFKVNTELLLNSLSQGGMTIARQCANAYAYNKLTERKANMNVFFSEDTDGALHLMQALNQDAVTLDGQVNTQALDARALLFGFYLHAVKRNTAQGKYLDFQNVEDVYNQAVLNVYSNEYREAKYEEILANVFNDYALDADNDEAPILQPSELITKARISYNKWTLARAFGQAYATYAREYQEHTKYTVSIDEQISHKDGTTSLREFVAPSIEQQTEETRRRHMSAQRILMVDYKMDAKTAKRTVQIYRGMMKGQKQAIADRKYIQRVREAYCPKVKADIYQGFTRPSRRKQTEDTAK
jgi:hypothetical protein